MHRQKVLIVDDSAVYRTQISAALEGVDWLNVVGTAPNGRVALERIDQLKPDFIVLDLEMPELDGIATLTEMRKIRCKAKTIIFSSLSKKGSEITLQALSLGASDYVTKPDASCTNDGSSPAERIRTLLLPKLEALRPKQVIIADTRRGTTTTKASSVLWDIFKPKMVVIGSSTGGPTVIEQICALLKPPFSCPIVIAQHMPPLFTTTFAERLSQIVKIPAIEAANGMPVLANQIYVAPGDYHTSITGTPDKPLFVTDQGPKINSVRPAVDPLFVSAAELYGERCLAIVLTGMGSDGKHGAAAIKEHGGAVVIQSEDTCVVFGMPGAVFASGNFDRVASPTEIASLLNEKISLSTLPLPRSGVAGGGRV